MNRRMLLLVLILLGIAAAPMHADDYSVKAIGSWFCRDGTTGAVLPLAGARVELWDSDCDGSTVCDDRMGFSYIRPDGSYEITGVGGDPGSYYWSKPDVYVRVVFNDDQGVRLTDELNNDRGANTFEHDHDNVEGLVDFGSWTTGLGTGPDQGTKCATWILARKAYLAYKQLLGANPPAGHYDVEYWTGVFSGTPWTNTDTTHWPVHFPTGAVNEHEFAHSVRHAADGDANHFFGDSVRFRYARMHEYCNSKHLADAQSTREAFAFNEGWAEFWEGYGWGCNPGAPDMTVEGDVAAALHDLSNCRGVGKPGMVLVLQKHPEAIHSFADFRRLFDEEFPGACAGVSRSPLAARQVPWAVLTSQAQRAAALKERQALLADISALNRQLAVAQLAARSVRLSCRGADCYAIFQTVIKPPLLDGSIRLKRLVLARLEENLRAGEQMRTRLSDGSFSSWYAENKHGYLRKVSDLNLTALRNALAAAGSLAERSPDAAPLVQDLRAKLSRLESDLREGKPPLPNLQPSVPSDAARKSTLR